MKFIGICGYGIFALLISGCKLFGASKQQSIASKPASFSKSCDVIVVGGTTAALGAAISAAEEFSLEGKNRVACLVEPTDWAGGQLTASGVSAVDFAHHKAQVNGKTLNVSKLSRDVNNNSKAFVEILGKVAPPRNGYFEMAENPAKCWVSVRCYQPSQMVPAIQSVLARYEKLGALHVIYNAVPKRVAKQDNTISSITFVKRIPRGGAALLPLSTAIEDWYSEESSNDFAKEMFTLSGSNGKSPTVIDATEWGEVLVLARASYMQGVEASEDAPENTNAVCGQAIVYPIAVGLSDRAEPLNPWVSSLQPPHPEHYAIDDESGAKFSWQDVWTYRRIAYRSGSGAALVRGVPEAGIGDISMQNWTNGNDYPYGYLFLSPSSAAAQASNWHGGVNVSVLADAEAHAVGWFKYYREKAPGGLGAKLKLVNSFGANYGLSKVPYIRDTRRSVGVGDFVMKFEGELAQGYVYPDSLGVGAYVPDVHATRNQGCVMSEHVKNANHNPQPFTLSMRAHTNRDVDNLLVAGKTMAQTFLANAATRLHPIEFASGTGAGVMAAVMTQNDMKATQLVSAEVVVKDVQQRINSRHGTTEWRDLDAAME